MKTKLMIVVGILVVLFVSGCTTTGDTTIENTTTDYDKIKTENIIMKAIFKAELTWSDISIASQKADNYYDLAGYAYEDDDWKSAEDYCRQARSYYFEESQGYRDIKAKLSVYDHKLIDVRIGALDTLIKVSNNMYEACEHFEAAVRYYAKDDYTMGGVEMEAMGDNIKTRDAAVGEYNDHLAQFDVELEKFVG